MHIRIIGSKARDIKLIINKLLICNNQVMFVTNYYVFQEYFIYDTKFQKKINSTLLWDDLRRKFGV
jgi:hypothetical protein